ncbi:hypothetical protein BIV57_17420 [Mangrovactinospora gilvigrisea]|uniref:Inositolphosphotransferase Aur1/Ipt1 domain-containing protein n=1 Tax=Mangrovactinospora gilvigrisea TaxID=1428644 RepID=A0A1J7C9C1_9ACTN|nr:hypothetical protein BIV57_17420 [Mangrovactinospora gilvigrisea]
MLIAFSYWLYSVIRNAVPEQETAAQHNARAIHGFEKLLHFDAERAVNHAVGSVHWLIVPMNYYYTSLHFVFTIAVLVWLFRWHPGRYAAARTALFVTTGLALVGFYVFPLAPPRLMAGGGFIDTVAVNHTVAAFDSGSTAGAFNQYAAMPSMHIGWSAWVGVTVWCLARNRWIRVLGLLYPVGTLVVIISTANHFLLDAAGGLVCLAAGFGASAALYGRWAFRFPRIPVQERRVAYGQAVDADRRPNSPVALNEAAAAERKDERAGARRIT